MSSLGRRARRWGLVGELEYSGSASSAARSRRWWAAWCALLGGGGGAPEVPLHQLEVLGPEERHSLLEEFNATARPLPGATVPELFEAQVARTPEALALLCGEERRLSYGELNARANRLAH